MFSTTDWRKMDSISGKNLLIALAGTAESSSEHPIGQAIYTYAKEVIIIINQYKIYILKKYKYF